jgi:hypothetical protein
MRHRQLRTAVTAAAALALAAPAGAAAQASPGTMHVVGNGVAFVKPDLATVMITVDKNEATRELARGRADRATNHIIGGLEAIGISRPDIQTSNVSLDSNTFRRHHHKVTRWDAEIDLTVTTSQVDLLGELFATASSDGANSFEGPNFGFSNPSAGLPEATAAAITDARSRADAAAAALGVQIVGVQSVDLDPGSTTVLQPPNALSAPTRGASAPKSPPPTPVLPGLQQVSATVDVVYLIGNSAT